VQQYAEATGRDLSHFDCYAKHVRGEFRDPVHGYFAGIVDQLLVRAERFAQ
jgi:hypothetical protein